MSEATSSVSIGMPVYNGEKFIRETLDSILRQTFTDFDLIISDNASTDDTESICREYAARDSRIRYCRQINNIGGLPNFEFVLREATGEYFMWTACDDIFGSQDYLAELLKVLTHGGYDLVFPAFNMIQTAEDGESRPVKQNVMSRFSRCNTQADYCVTSVYLSLQIYGLFRRTSLLQNYCYLERARKRLGSDCFFAQAISAKLSLRYVPHVIRIYRFHSGQASRSLSPLNDVIDYVKLSRMCAEFWIRESNVAIGTRLKVLFAMLHWHGYGFLRRSLSAIKRSILKPIASPGHVG